MFTVMAGMFYGAGVLLENVDDINQEDVFKALFGIMFGAWASGNATAFGPDTGKAKVAADRIF
jgi:ATP-binding cassette, subfamily B (MDR/TAP), member 1